MCILKACKKCAECVTKALDGCEVIEPKDHDYSSCFIHEGIGEELTLDFSNVTLDDLPEQDQSGKKGKGPRFVCSQYMAVLKINLRGN